MKIAYLTSTNFLDTAIDTIQSIKNKVELHVFIEVTDISKKSTISEISSIHNLNFIEHPEKVLDDNQWKKMKPYFNGVASVQFIVHQNKRSFSPITILKMMSLGVKMKNQRFDAIHFDNISYRALGLFPFIKKNKIIITLHDPLPHSGEEKGFNKEKFVNSFFLKNAKAFVFYSNFAANQFSYHFKSTSAPVYSIKLQPCSYFSQSLPVDIKCIDNKPILFFGRLSYYKGIDILLAAIPIVLKSFPNEKFIIAGKPSYDYKINETEIAALKSHVSFIPHFIDVKKAAELFHCSKFVVCPYRDATQSGVLATAAAMGKSVIASNVGSFSEYIDHDVTGLLAKPEAEDIAKKIIYALTNNRFEILEKYVVTKLSDTESDKISSILLKAYA